MRIELGKFNQLEVVKEVDFGMYLDGGEEGEILLPTRYVPENCQTIIGTKASTMIHASVADGLLRSAKMTAIIINILIA